MVSLKKMKEGQCLVSKPHKPGTSIVLFIHSTQLHWKSTVINLFWK